MKIRMTLIAIGIVTSGAMYAQCNGNSHAKQTNQHYTSPANSVHGKDIVDVAVEVADFSTLVVALKAADLVKTLQSDGPFTVFAPLNSAFAKLPDGTVGTLLKPENKDQLTKVLTYHVVAGNFTATDIVAAIESSGGSFTLKTVSGGLLTAKLVGDNVILTDENGGTSAVTKTDVKATNGVIHVIDTVVLPK